MNMVLKCKISRPYVYMLTLLFSLIKEGGRPSFNLLCLEPVRITNEAKRRSGRHISYLVNMAKMRSRTLDVDT